MFGVLPGVVGSIQAVEAIKLITGVGEPLVGRLLLFDALDMEFTTVKLRWDPDCPVCGKHPTITELIDYDLFCGLPSRRRAARATGGMTTMAVKVKIPSMMREPPAARPWSTPKARRCARSCRASRRGTRGPPERDARPAACTGS